MKDRLKKIRLTLGYNQQTIADKLSIDVRKLRSYEYETKNYPTEFLQSLVDVFNVNINWLLSGQGEMFLPTCFNTYQKKDNSNIVKNIDTFYKRFNQLQKENDLNDYQLSKETGIAEERIEKLGIGKVQPTLEDLKALKSHFDVSIDWLLFGDTPCQQPQNDNTTLSPDEISILKKMAQQFTK